ncbi:MAG: 30S ribosomal protein S9 [Proteobacteria bacterium]|nr:30S ribosomal protein S9 [Pseudomonadota bacterium]
MVATHPEVTHAVGKRKMAVARVWLKPGNGQIVINRQPMDTYLTRATSKMIVKQPLKLSELSDQLDILVNVRGGGLSGQAEAIRHGIAKAISLFDPEKRAVIKKAKLLTRDARQKERKLPGQPGARKRFQFSKR